MNVGVRLCQEHIVEQLPVPQLQCSKCFAMTSATQQVNLFAVGICRNSFGPCALENLDQARQ